MSPKIKGLKFPASSTLFSAHFLFFCYLSLYSLAIIVGFFSLLELPTLNLKNSSIIAALSIFDLFCVEFLLVILAGLWLLNGKRYLRVIAYAMASLSILIQGIQLASFYQGKEFISKLAVENINHISLILNVKTITAFISLIITCLLLIFIVEKRVKHEKKGHSPRLLLSISLTVICLLLVTSSSWLPGKIVTDRDTLLFENYMKHSSPILALYQELSSSETQDTGKFSSFELKEIRKHGFQVDFSKEFPFIKNSVHNGQSPFELKENKTDRPNIIVFFSEGLSARALSSYGSVLHSDLTPNIDNFAEKSMMVKNYYNHTAATYRGMLGQLCSLFPAHGGAVPEARYLSLSNIFNARDYDTIFFDAHDKDRAHVDELMYTLGFKTVYTGKPLSKKYLNNAKLQGGESLSDNQFLESFVGFLKERNNSKTKEKPFFLCLYNLGTHSFKKITPDGKRYVKVKKNLSLDTIHNYDFSFGKFWEYFQNSTYKENTIIFFTSDHAHYPEKPFLEAFLPPREERFFIDRIPLIIYDQTRKLPKIFDADYSTSIDFAPSLLHYLNIANGTNPFMGTSIFSKKEDHAEKFGLAQFGKGVYIIDNGKIHRNKYTKKHKKRLALIWKFIKYSQEIETTGKMWDTTLNETGAE